MNASPWVHDLFATIDTMDAAAFAALITEDGSFTFGNWPAAVGRAAVTETVANFFAGIAGISHELVGAWTVSGVTVTEGLVSYTRHDGSHLTVPFCNVLRHGADGKISDYRVYADVSTLFAPAG